MRFYMGNDAQIDAESGLDNELYSVGVTGNRSRY